MGSGTWQQVGQTIASEFSDPTEALAANERREPGKRSTRLRGDQSFKRCETNSPS